MHCTVKMTEDLYWVGASDRRLALFESVYPIPRGVSYNAYVLLDEKTVLLDTVDQSVAGQFFENLTHVLGGRPLDYIVVHHMEPDHAKTLEETVRRYPEAKIICNAKIRDMIRNYFTFDIDSRAILMTEGGTYCFGKHTFAYVMAPMVHWPEVMVSFDTTTGTLFPPTPSARSARSAATSMPMSMTLSTTGCPMPAATTRTSSASTARRCRHCSRRPLRSISA